MSRWLRPLPDAVRRTGLGFGGSFRRMLPYALFGWLAIPVLAAPFVGALLGVFPLDVTGFSGFREALRQAPGPMPPIPVGMLVAIQLAVIVPAVLFNAIPAFGEEWGWRGYLLQRLLSLGQWPALLITGVIWGLWHAPVILLGYNYPNHPYLGLLAMVGLTVVLGTLLGWTRLASGSVWPAVLGHGAFNASAGGVVLFAAAGQSYSALLVGVTGVTGWLAFIVVIGVLVVTRRLPVRTGGS